MNAKTYIIEQIKKNYDDIVIQPIIFNIDSSFKSINTGNDIYILNNSILDIPVTAQLNISSDDNHYTTSKIDFENQKDYKYQIFTGHIDIELRNYGTDFIPYQLEFVKITPLKNRCKQENNQCNQKK